MKHRTSRTIRPLAPSRYVAILFSTLQIATAAPLAAQAPYTPPAGSWERRTPEQVGLDPAAVAEAVRIAQADESTNPRDLLENHLRSFGREPYGEAIGPFRDRGEASGLIIRRGYIVAEWGDPDRVENTFSVTKSFLSTAVGLAYDRKLIPDLTRPVAELMAPVIALKGPPGGRILAGVVVPPTWNGVTAPPAASGVAAPPSAAVPAAGVAYDAFEVIDLFASEHNRLITWEHLLRQSSDWQGTLWGKPDWADRPRGDTVEWMQRARHQPGSVYTYNDVRVNVLALAALNVWRRPLPQVLREHVMDPIGASPTWRWVGYDNSWVVMDGQLVQSVSGGAHWGGGMFISARDMARFGLLTLRRGRWGDRQVLSDEWIRMATSPGTAQGGGAYGFMNYFLNVGERPQLPSAPREAFYHLGAGTNVVYVDPVNNIVIVARWITNMRAMDQVVGQVLAGIRR